MEDSRLPQKGRIDKAALEANIAGGSGGTLIALLTQKLPENSDLKFYLLLSTPFLAIFLRGFWKWIKIRLDENSKEKRLKKLVSKNIEFINTSLKDPNLSRTRKAQLKKDYDKLNEILSKIHFDKINAIKLQAEYSSLIKEISDVEDSLKKEKEKPPKPS